MKNWFNLVRNEGGKKLLVYIHDVIDPYWGKSAKDFIREVNDAKADVEEIEVHINSAGGSVFDGLAIFNFLRAQTVHVATFVDGMAASIASVIALAGKKLTMPENAYLMIHEPWTYTVGNASEIMKDVELLNKLTDTLASIYAAATGKDIGEIKEMMSAETWLNGKEAAEKGFAHELIPSVAAMAAIRCPDFRNAPEAVKALMDTETAPEAIDPNVQNAAKTPEAEVPPPPPDLLASAVALFNEYVAEFGRDRGSEYLLSGLAMDAARSRFVADLKAENERLHKQTKANASAAAISGGVNGHSALPADPAGDEQCGILWKQYNAITDPAEKTKFWNAHEKELRAEQQSLTALNK